MNVRERYCLAIQTMEAILRILSTDGDDPAKTLERARKALEGALGLFKTWSRQEFFARLDHLRGRTKRRKLSDSVRRFVRQRDEDTCGTCGLAVAEEELELDHHIAVANGGTDDPDNLRVTHARCNNAKGAELVL